MKDNVNQSWFSSLNPFLSWFNRLKQLLKKHPAGPTDKKIPWPKAEEIAALPWFEELPWDQILVVDTPESARQALDELSREKVVGFDTESKPTFRKGEASHGPHVAQFSTLKRAYVFMLHQAECRMVASALIKLTTLKKVGFGLNDDLTRIRAKLRISPSNVIDLETLFSARGYGRGVGVKVAVAIAFNRRFRKSKKASTSNWGAQNLSDRQILYAANDAFAAIKVFHAVKASPAAN
jgi:ribonuclease D